MLDYTKSDRLGLQVRDYVVLKEEDIELREEDGSLLFEVGHNMVGKVIKVSDNIVAQQIREETGLPLDSAWALVEFENGAQTMLNPRSKFEKGRPTEAFGSGSVFRHPIPFIVNRPFIFLIHDRRTGAVLFIGRVTNPNQETPNAG